MKTELLEVLSKVAGIGGICLGIFLIIASKILKKGFLKIFPQETAARMAIFNLTLTWSLAVLGVLVWMNSDMETFRNLNSGEADYKANTITKVESRSAVQSGVYPKNDSLIRPEAEASINQKEGGYKSTNIVRSYTEIESKKKETKNSLSTKQKAVATASSIPISILNSIFTIIFLVFMVWIIFIASSFFYNNTYVTFKQNKTD